MFKTLVLKIIVLRPNKKNSWLASHSHKFAEAGGRFFKNFYSFKKIFNSIFWGDGGGFSAISVIFFVLMFCEGRPFDIRTL